MFCSLQEIFTSQNFTKIMIGREDQEAYREE